MSTSKYERSYKVHNLTTERDYDTRQRERNLPTFELGREQERQEIKTAEGDHDMKKSQFYQRQKNLHGRDEIDSNEKAPEGKNEFLTNTEYSKALVYGTWGNSNYGDKSRSTRSRRSKSESRKGKTLNCKDMTHDRLLFLNNSTFLI